MLSAIAGLLSALHIPHSPFRRFLLHPPLDLQVLRLVTTQPRILCALAHRRSLLRPDMVKSIESLYSISCWSMRCRERVCRAVCMGRTGMVTAGAIHDASPTGANDQPILGPRHESACRIALCSHACRSSHALPDDALHSLPPIDQSASGGPRVLRARTRAATRVRSLRRRRHDVSRASRRSGDAPNVQSAGSCNCFAAAADAYLPSRLPLPISAATDERPYNERRNVLGEDATLAPRIEL